MDRSIPALTLAGALVLGSALVAAPAQAAPGDGTYYSVPFSGDLYVTEAYEDDLIVVQAGFDAWSAAGFPAPVPAKVAYRSFSWSPDIYADVQTEPSAVMTIGLGFEEWQAAGSPRPTTDILPATSGVYRYGYSDEVYVSVYSYGSDYAHGHKLTFAEYRRIGSPTPFIRSGAFQKLSWYPAIVGPSFFTTEVMALDFDDWDLSSRPTPQIVESFDGERFCQTAGSADIRYVGIAAPPGVTLSYGQWREAGSPVPARC